MRIQKAAMERFTVIASYFPASKGPHIRSTLLISIIVRQEAEWSL